MPARPSPQQSCKHSMSSASLFPLLLAALFRTSPFLICLVTSYMSLCGLAQKPTQKSLLLNFLSFPPCRNDCPHCCSSSDPHGTWDKLPISSQPGCRTLRIMLFLAWYRFFMTWGRRNGNRTERREGYGSNKLLSYHQFHWQNTISIPTVWTTEKTVEMATRIPLKRSPFTAHRKVSYNSFFSPLSLSSKVQPLPERLQSLTLFLLSAELHSWICFLPAVLPIFNL